ncbi:alpha/beta-hydrolase [Apiospora phragmitis]|uniref:Alpha/beta-hydrolase n=1 Tax=Apiospora phragmitis TaxID=2905665 RepID=A0ABR1WVP9_9PEZI
MASSPVLVLCPGAFGGPDGFNKLLPFLSEAGIATQPGGYPSCNPPDPTQATCAADIAHLRDNVLLPILDQQQRDVVLLAHSYGGVVGGAASKGLDKQTRAAQGHPTSIIGLIYVAGNITLEGESLLEAVGGAYPPFIKLNKVCVCVCSTPHAPPRAPPQNPSQSAGTKAVPKPSPNVALIEPHMDILYNDCDASQAAALGQAMAPHANLAFETKPSAPGWADAGFDAGRRVYVRTRDDCCNPASLQDVWLAKSQVRWEVVDFQSGHMPFVSRPEALAAQIVTSVRGFVAL